MGTIIVTAVLVVVVGLIVGYMVKFHMSVGKTKFYAVKLACAYAIFILLMLGLVETVSSFV